MWDVVWTDPDRELVGEHRAKKGGDEVKQKKKPKPRSGRTSISTTSSRSSIETPFSLFRSRGLKRTHASGNPGAMASSIPSGLNSPGIAAMRSPLSQTFEESGRPSSDHSPAGILNRHIEGSSRAGSASGRLVQSSSGISRSTSNDVDSIFSSSIAETTMTNSTDDILEDGAMTESEKMRSILQMLEEDAQLPEWETSQTSVSGKFLEEGLSTSESSFQGETRTGGVSTPPLSPTHSARHSLSSLKLDPAASPTFLVPPLKSPLRMFAPRWTAFGMPNQKDARKEDHRRTLTPPGSRESMLQNLSQEAVETKSGNESSVLANVENLEEQIAKMAMTQAEEQALLLQDLWNETNRMGPESFRGEGKTVTEMRRWMISAMHHLDLQHVCGKSRALKAPSVTASMVLVLQESPVFVSFLAVLHQSKQLYDLSLSARSYDKLPNIRNIPVASLFADDFPVAPRIFEAVHSLTLPSQCPSDALGRIVKSVARSLKVGGAFHLTLIDPLPRTGTMGPRMRTWIEDNLLRNLARESRCMSPSTLFPQLLGEAGLRSKGSTLTTTKFFAIPQSARRGEEDPDAEAEKVWMESKVKAEVRSLVGRMLWVEVWGAHMAPDKWWWEEEACVRECIELGTFWEYHAIKGVNGLNGEEHQGEV